MLCFLPILARSNYILSFALTILLWVSLASAWNVISGFTGYISLGHGVFYGLSIYLFAFLSSYGYPIIFNVVLSTIIVTMIGAPIGYVALRRSRGVYFSIVTLCFGGAIRAVVNWLEVRAGVKGISFSAISMNHAYYLVLSFTAVSLLLVYAFTRTKSYVACQSIREDEGAAETVGINATRYKMYAFILSVFICALMGSAMGTYLGYVSTVTAFSFATSFNMAIMACFGGVGTLLGPIVGPLFFTIMTEAFGTAFVDIHLILTGVLFVVVVLFLPHGILSLRSLNPKDVPLVKARLSNTLKRLKTRISFRDKTQ